jgi:hypothetical protein
MAVALAVALAVVLKAEAALGWPVMLNLWSSGWCSWSGSSHGFTLAPEGTATDADSADCEYTSGTKGGRMSIPITEGRRGVRDPS